MNLKLGKFDIPLYDSFAFAYGFFGKKSKYIVPVLASLGGILDLKISRTFLKCAKNQETSQQDFSNLEITLAHKTYSTEAIKFGAKASISVFSGNYARKLYNTLHHKSL